MPLDRARRLFVIAPHADDEAVGCGATIARASDAGLAIDVAYLGVGNEDATRTVRGSAVIGTGVYRQDRESPTTLRAGEAQEALRILAPGARSRIICPGLEGVLDAQPIRSILVALDGFMGSIDERPVIVLAPIPSSHQDHVVAHRVARSLVRRRGLSGIVGLLLYEYGVQRLSEDGGVLYVEVSRGAMRRKEEAMRAYVSELRDRDKLDPLSVDTATLRARVRGRECGAEFAEAFRVEWLSW